LEGHLRQRYGNNNKQVRVAEQSPGVKIKILHTIACQLPKALVGTPRPKATWKGTHRRFSNLKIVDPPTNEEKIKISASYRIRTRPQIWREPSESFPFHTQAERDPFICPEPPTVRRPAKFSYNPDLQGPMYVSVGSGTFGSASWYFSIPSGHCSDVGAPSSGTFFVKIKQKSSPFSPTPGWMKNRTQSNELTHVSQQVL